MHGTEGGDEEGRRGCRNSWLQRHTTQTHTYTLGLTLCTHTHTPRAYIAVNMPWRTCIRHTKKLWEWFKLEDNLMHKVALSPHVISVWIKMDYWITRASTERERETAPDKKYGWLKLAGECIFLYLDTVCDVLKSLNVNWRSLTKTAIVHFL